MNNIKKNIRFLFWFIIEYIRSHLALIIISFFSVIIIIFLLASFKPIILRTIFGKKIKLGRVGNYSLNNPPKEVLNLISQPIVQINEKGEIIPILIEQWEIREKGKSFRLFFRKDLIWNDGKLFNVTDIKDNLVKDSEIKIIDNYTLEINLPKETIILPYYLNKPIYRKPLIGLGGNFKTKNIETKNGRILKIDLINKNTSTNLIIKYYDSEYELKNAFKTGKIDQFTTQNYDLIAEFENWKNTDLKKRVNYNSLVTLFFNLRKDFLKEIKVRNAINMLIPWHELEKQGEIARGPIPPTSSFYNPKLPQKIYNPKKGTETLKELIKVSTDSSKNDSNKKNNNKIEQVILKIKTDYRLLPLAENLANEINKSGINTSVEIVNNISDLDFDILLAFWNVPIDIDQYFFWHSKQIHSSEDPPNVKANITGYVNLKVDQLLENARSTLEFSKQLIALRDFQEEIVKEKPAIFLYFPFEYEVTRKNIL